MCVLPPKNHYFEFLVDKDSQQFSIETDSFDLVKNIQITYSPLNQLFYKDIHFISLQSEKVRVLQQKIKDAKIDSIAIKTYQCQLKGIDDSVKVFRKNLTQENPNSFYTSILRAKQEPEAPQNPNPKDTLFAYHYYKSHYWEGVDFNDERLLRTPILHNKIDYYLDKLTIPCFDSTIKEIRFLCENVAQNKKMYQYFVVTILNKYGSMCTNTKWLTETYFYVLEEYYVNREPFWCDSIQRQKLINRLEGWKRTTAPVGVIAPNLNMRNEQDEWISMKKEKAIDWILYFWNLEDENARIGIAEIKKIVTKYGKILPDMKVYAVAVGGTRELFKAKVKEYGLDLPNIINVADPNNETKYQSTYEGTISELIYPNTARIGNFAQEEQFESQFSLYPNPANGNFIIYNKNENMITEIIILDTNGREIWKQKIGDNPPTIPINLENYAKGIYFLRLKLASSEQSMKFIHQ
jgi:hypothetical protein